MLVGLALCLADYYERSRNSQDSQIINPAGRYVPANTLYAFYGTHTRMWTHTHTHYAVPIVYSSRMEKNTIIPYTQIHKCWEWTRSSSAPLADVMNFLVARTFTPHCCDGDEWECVFVCHFGVAQSPMWRTWLYKDPTAYSSLYSWRRSHFPPARRSGACNVKCSIHSQQHALIANAPNKRIA